MATDSLIGVQLGKFELRSLLGKGGMAEVYKGYDSALGREVAIKVISTANQPADFVKRFQREASIAANLDHPHIVHIYEINAQSGFIYVAQQLLQGPSLEQKIRKAGKRYIPLKDVHAIMEQLASALDFAHTHNVTHRDVKPSNVLFNHHNELILTDFGIAHRTADNAHTITQEGVVMGTPGYVAPEQAISSANVTPACDIYSLGVVLFQLLTGRLPFESGTTMEIVLKHLYEEPPLPSKLRPDIPRKVDEVVLRAMSKEPKKRYRSAGELAQAFQKAWPDPKATPSASSSRSSQKSKSAASNDKDKHADGTDAPKARRSRRPVAQNDAARARDESKKQKAPPRSSKVSEQSDTPVPRKSNWLLRIGIMLLLVVVLVVGVTTLAYLLPQTRGMIEQNLPQWVISILQFLIDSASAHLLSFGFW